MANRALIVVDVQNDFTEGGALACDGGAATAQAITEFVAQNGADYELIVASRDWHDATGDNGGHFSPDPDFVDTWPAHCVAGTPGADYHPNLKLNGDAVHVRKGQGLPAYSAFEGVTDQGELLGDVLRNAGIDSVDVVGIATDYCVHATAKDALEMGLVVTVKANLCVGVNPGRTVDALSDVATIGARITLE
jgi:nicotinamidase/pyrazinamidase